MAIDPRISLGVQTPNVNIQAPDPWQRVQRMMTLRDMMQRRELYAEQIQAQREAAEFKRQQVIREQEQERALQDLIVSRSGGQAPAAIPQLAGYAPSGETTPSAEPQEISLGEYVSKGGVDLGTKLYKTQLETDKERRLATSADLDVKEKRAKLYGNIAQFVLLTKTQVAHNAGVMQALREKLITPEEARQAMDRRFDSPETVAGWQAIAGESQASLEQIKSAREQEEWEAKEPGVVAESAGKVYTAAQQQLERDAGRLAAAAARGPEFLKTALAELGERSPETARHFVGFNNPYQIMKRALEPKEYAAAEMAEYGKTKAPSTEVQAYERSKPRPSRLLTAEEEAQQIRIGGARAAAVGEAKPPTEGERKVMGYLDMMQYATDILEKPRTDAKGGKLPSLEDYSQKLTRLEQQQLFSAPNDIQSVEGQQYNQAVRMFTAARLRKESGATIQPHEIQDSIQTYFPWPGDKPPVLKQKREARQKLLDSLKGESGQAWKLRQRETAAAGGKKATKKYNPQTGKLEEISNANR